MGSSGANERKRKHFAYRSDWGSDASTNAHMLFLVYKAQDPLLALEVGSVTHTSSNAAVKAYMACNMSNLYIPQKYKLVSLVALSNTPCMNDSLNISSVGSNRHNDALGWPLFLYHNPLLRHLHLTLWGVSRLP